MGFSGQVDEKSEQTAGEGEYGDCEGEDLDVFVRGLRGVEGEEDAEAGEEEGAEGEDGRGRRILPGRLAWRGSRHDG